MTQNAGDICRNIATSLDPDDILDRLGISSEDLVKKFKREILSNLDKFDDIYDPEEEEYADWD